MTNKQYHAIQIIMYYRIAFVKRCSYLVKWIRCNIDKPLIYLLWQRLYLRVWCCWLFTWAILHYLTIKMTIPVISRIINVKQSRKNKISYIAISFWVQFFPLPFTNPNPRPLLVYMNHTPPSPSLTLSLHVPLYM